MNRFFHAGRDIASKDQFTPQILLDQIQDLGIIIDLTATTRYYDPREFEDNDVQYIKILTQGHQVPSHDVISKFAKAVNNFLERNGHNDKKIGVHCTHGINRTGYLICHYMISTMKMKPTDAIDRFASCRGYPIERNNYIHSLNNIAQPEVLPKNERNNLSIDCNRDNLRRQHGNYERRVDRSRSSDLTSRPCETPTTRRVSRVSRVTDRNDRKRSIEQPRNYDRPRERGHYEYPRGRDQRDHDQPRSRELPHHSYRNYEQPLSNDLHPNGNSIHRPRYNSNGRPPIGDQPSRDYNRYHWTPRNQNSTNSMPRSSDIPPRHR